MSFKKKFRPALNMGILKSFYVNFHLIVCNHLDNWILKNMKDFKNTRYI